MSITSREMIPHKTGFSKPQLFSVISIDAQTMKDSLIRFSQILDIATPEEKKFLIPRIVESVTFTPTQIEIALFDHLIERGLLRPPVNHSDDDALELSTWLPRLDSNQRQGGYTLPHCFQ
jgi:hypothetical protein